MPRSMVGHPNLILETLPEVCTKLGWELESNPKRLWGQNEWGPIYGRIRAKGFRSTFQLQQMPGCCAVLIACYVDPEPYTKKYFDPLIQAIEDAAKEAGFGSLMLAQVIHKPRVVDHIWSGCLDMGYEMSRPFINAKSGNQVVYLTKNLGQQGKVAGLEI